MFSLQEGMWYALNMKDAYFHVGIHPSQRKFLHFLIDPASCVVPFGLATACRVYMQVFSVAAAQMRCHGYTVFPYLDDWLL